MKYFVIVIIIAIAAYMVLELDVLLPKPAKVYIEYREKVMTAKGYSPNMSSSAKWSIKITSCKIEDAKATIMAIEKTSKIPMNAASHVFAVKTTRELRAVLWKKDEVWKLGRESVLKEDVSTYDDRKNSI